MNRSKVKIISSNSSDLISYFFMNEKGTWMQIPQTNILSRSKYIHTNFSDSGAEILSAIVEIYNVANRGIDLYFEGSNEEAESISSLLKEYHSDQDVILYYQCKTPCKVAVLGQLSSGKTTLIKEACIANGAIYDIEDCGDKINYHDISGSTLWTELSGIDLGIENVASTKSSVHELVQLGYSTILYCIKSRKIEDTEISLLKDLSSTLPNVKVYIVLTCCIYDDAEQFANELNCDLHIPVIPVLAQQFSLRGGVIPAFGIRSLLSMISEGMHYDL